VAPTLVVLVVPPGGYGGVDTSSGRRRRGRVGELEVVEERYRRAPRSIRLEAGGELDALRPGVVEPAKVRQRVPGVVRDDRA
jgi:hypothetical protein